MSRERGNGGGGRDRERDSHSRLAAGTDEVVAHERLPELPRRAGPQVRRVDHELWRVGKVLERRVSEEVPLERTGEVTSAARHLEQNAVEVLTGKPQQRLQHLAREPTGHTTLVEVELSPPQAQQRGGDRARRDARDSVEPRKEPGLVQAHEGAGVEQHRAVAAAGQAQRRTGLERKVSQQLGVGLRRPRRPRHIDLTLLRQCEGAFHALGEPPLELRIIVGREQPCSLSYRAIKLKADSFFMPPRS